jgi:hypothetical protein
LTDRPEVTEGLVVTASAELGISRSLVYRLVAKFRKVLDNLVDAEIREIGIVIPPRPAPRFDGR